MNKINLKINKLLYKNLKYNNIEEIIINNNNFITELTLFNNNSRINIYYNKEDNKYYININISGHQDFNLINNNNREILILLKSWLNIININQDIIYNK